MAIGDYEPLGGSSASVPLIREAIRSQTTPLRNSREGVTDALIGAKDAVNSAIGFNPSAGTLPRGSTSILEFPLDVASGDAALGNHGHYIMFYINEQDKAQLSMSDRASGGSIADNLGISTMTPSANYYIPDIVDSRSLKEELVNKKWNNLKSVSYTHLTLPTNREV